MTEQTYITLGNKESADSIRELIEFKMKVNVNNRQSKPTPLCIWGRHGIGKTQLVEAIARDNGWAFGYIAPAQFEEMGDLLGLPSETDGKTTFSPPEWVPSSDGPGLFLLDDINRADDRILRGLMQLLQNYELISWKFPQGWQIVCTANPDGGDYSVTPMDDAMLTRMLHVTMTYDEKAWASWAEDQALDERGINFVLLYPDVVTGTRTTPRTLEQFFRLTKHIKNLRKELSTVRLLGNACLDAETVESFVQYVKTGDATLISPADILGKDFDKFVAPTIEKLVKQDIFRADILSVLFSRLFTFLKKKKSVKKKELANFKQLVLLPWIPLDLRLSLLQDTVKAQKAIASIASDPEVAVLLLDQM